MLLVSVFNYEYKPMTFLSIILSFVKVSDKIKNLILATHGKILQWSFLIELMRYYLFNIVVLVEICDFYCVSLQRSI